MKSRGSGASGRSRVSQRRWFEGMAKIGFSGKYILRAIHRCMHHIAINMNLFCALLVCTTSALGEQSFTSLMARTRQARDALNAQSMSIESELKRVVDMSTPPKPSLLQTESLAKEKARFEASQSSLLEHDARIVNERKQRYDAAIARLQADAARIGQSMTTCVVMDAGSFSVKAGLSTDEVPQVIRSLVGRSRKVQTSKNPPAPYVGDSALANGDTVELNHPIAEGMIDDFADFELLTKFVYSALKADSTEHPVVIGEAPFNSGPNREKTAELLFEQFQVPELNIMLNGILALVGTGRVTGLVIDCGHGGSHIVPIFESYVIPHAIETLQIGGKDLDVLLAKLFALRDVRMARTSQKEILRHIKEKHCFCRPSADWQQEEDGPDRPREGAFTLPDGSLIQLGNERFVVPEAYFSPSLVRCEGEGLAAMVANCIKSSPIDLTKPLVSNIILSGGSAQFQGFAQRLSNEVKYRVSAKMSREVKIVAVDEKKNFLVWNGGKAFADLRSSFEERWMTKAEYEEYGPYHIHTKVMGSVTM